MSIKIFVMTHKQFEAPTDSMYVPLQVGHAISPELGYLADDTGDSISRKNKSFCELTGIYWLWKITMPAIISASVITAAIS